MPPDAKIDKAHKFDKSSILRIRQEDTDLLQLKKGHLTKVRMVVEESPTLIRKRVFNQVSGAPYADSFNPEEEWIITSTEDGCPKCVVRHSIYVNFHKSSMMQSLITNKSFSSNQQNFNAWAGWVKDHLPEHYDFREAQEEVEINNEQAKRWNDPDRADSIDLNHPRALKQDLFQSDSKTAQIRRDRTNTFSSERENPLGLSTNTVMLKRSTFSVDETIEEDVGRRTVILEKSHSMMEPAEPDPRINILIGIVILLFLAVAFLTMNVMSLSSKVSILESNDPYKMCWIIGPNGKI